MGRGVVSEIRRGRKVPPTRAWTQARIAGRFRVSAEWICDDFESAEELADVLMREDHAETTGVTPLAENRCGCCGSPLADEGTA